MIRSYVIDGVRILTGGGAELERDRRITWMSDWSRADELADHGLIYRRHYGPSTYGHVDFYMPEPEVAA